MYFLGFESHARQENKGIMTNIDCDKVNASCGHNRIFNKDVSTRVEISIRQSVKELMPLKCGGEDS